jgi:hypothetical protein
MKEELKVGPDTKLATNEKGGQQSDIPYRFDLVDPTAMFEVAKVYGNGARKYTINNWRLITRRDHLNHCLMHIYAYMAGDTQEPDHLSHALCRLTMALGIEENEDEYPYTKIPQSTLDQAKQNVQQRRQCNCGKAKIPRR